MAALLLTMPMLLLTTLKCGAGALLISCCVLHVELSSSVVASHPNPLQLLAAGLQDDSLYPELQISVKLPYRIHEIFLVLTLPRAYPSAEALRARVRSETMPSAAVEVMTTAPCTQLLGRWFDVLMALSGPQRDVCASVQQQGRRRSRAARHNVTERGARNLSICT